MRTQIKTTRAATLVLGALIAAALLPAPAPAAQLHGLSQSFGEPGEGAGQLALASNSGLAVNEETGDVYVADTANHRVSEFSSSGAFIRAFGWGVEDGSAELQTCTTTCQAGLDGSKPGQLEAPVFIAVDNSAGPSHGDLYVADSGDGLITKFTAAGALVSSWGDASLNGPAPQGQLDGSSATPTPDPPSPTHEPGHAEFPTGFFGTIEGPFEGLEGIAVDPSGNLWVLGSDSRRFEFSQAGTFTGLWRFYEGSKPAGLGLDANGHFYLVDGFGRIERIEANAHFGGAMLKESGINGLAVDAAGRALYVDRSGASIAAISLLCESFPCSPIQVLGEGILHEAAGLAVDSANGTLYAAETEADEIDVFAVTLEATAKPATEVEATTATANGTVDPKSSPVIRCGFQYGTDTSYGSELPCLNEAGEEVGTEAKPIETPIEVHADLTGLAGGTRYHFRLRVGNEAGGFISSEDETLDTKPLATIDEATATEVTATGATLNAKVNPHGLAPTKAHFEWGPCQSVSTCVEDPYPNSTPEEELGGGSSAVSISASLEGLSPNLTYHFRVVAGDTNGTATSPDHTFVFLTETPVPPGSCPANEALREANNSTALPDCRAYELVTPMDKNGSLIGALLQHTVPPQIAADGQRLIAPAIQCFANSPSCIATRIAEGEPFSFQRTGAGWSATSLALPATSFDTSSAWGFNADTGAALFDAPLPSEVESDHWYVRAADGSLANLGPIWNGSRSYFILGNFVTTADISHVLYSTNVPAWPFDQGKATGSGLYEYPGSDGGGSEPQLVGVSGGPGSHDLIGICGTSVAGGEGLSGEYGTVSADGRTTYFEVSSCEGGSGANAGHEVPTHEIFARIEGEGPGARTVAISAPHQLGQANPACASPQCVANSTDPQGFRDAHFQGASTDGAMAYFTSPQQLTDEASQDPNRTDAVQPHRCTETTGANGCNLYLYEDPQESPLSGTHLFDVSAGDSSGLGPEVQGMFALSTDGSHAYFVAKGVLTRSPNSDGQRAEEGANNLYLYERDAANPQGQTTFVASLGNSVADLVGDGVGGANVTPDGRYLVFQSHRGLTPDAAPGEGPAQIYRYDAVTGQLLRISIGQRGFGDNGNGGNAGADAAIVPASKGIADRTGPVRSDPTMSHDGRYVFFQSPVALTPGALNEVLAGAGGIFGESLAQNLYEWQAPSTPGCEEDSGCVYLISDGKDTAEPSYPTIKNVVELLGTDASGENVFFATSSQLTWADTDTQRDYYDARVGGGFAQPPAQVPCEGDACKGQSTHPGAEQSPATPGFSGPEEGPGHPRNKCEKGSVKKHGRCVKRNSKKHHKAKKHHKNHARRADANRRTGR